MPDTKTIPLQEITEEIFSLLGTGRQVTTYSSRYPGFGLTEGYDIVNRVRDLRKTRGENPVGRKIGFTNRSVWKGYGISGPIWNYMYDTTVRDLAKDDSFPVKGFPELRVEPEIALHLAKTPAPGMDESALLECIDWIAHGFEMVHSIFRDWHFSAADAAAAYGVHSGLLLGEKHFIAQNREHWGKALSNFAIELMGAGERRMGSGRNVLDGPLTALKFLVDEIAKFPGSEPLRAGEIVTTGTLTEAMPAVPGETWQTALKGINIKGIKVRFT